MFRPDFKDLLPMGLLGRIPSAFNPNEFSFAERPKDRALPLKSTSVTTKLTGYVVAMSSIFKYSNDTQNPLEVLFRFPVDESYAVVELEAIIGGRKIKATLKEKEEAKQDYDDAIASGYTAALAEEKTGDIFNISLGNLLPQSSAEIHLKMVGELPLNAEGGVHFTLPGVLKPRHVSAGFSNPLDPYTTHMMPSRSSMHPQQESAPAVFDFNLHILNPSLVSTVTSPTHSVITQHNEESIVVSLGQPQPLESDLVISIMHTDPHTPSAVVECGSHLLSQRSYMGAPAVMLNFFPKFDTKQAACEFIFLIDRSGSMSGGYMRSAKETLKLFLKSIPSGCRFNIIGFGSRYENLFSESVTYTQENLDHAVSKTDKMFANLGGTELLPPLKYINSQPPLSGLSRQVFVLTDGAVSNTSACIEEVKKHASDTRVFTFGIGSGASTELVKGLAKAGDGKAEFVQEGERMQPKVIASLKRALQPAVTDFEVVFDLPSGFQASLAPEKLPVIYNSDKTTIFGVLKSTALSDDPLHTSVEGTATLRGKIVGQSFEFLLPFRVPESSSAEALTVVHQLAAKALIQDWRDGFSGLNKQDVIDLSIESSVISSQTAYVAIDENQDKPIEGAVKVWDILATPPSGSLGTLFGGYSPATFGAQMQMQGGPPPPMRSGMLGSGYSFSNSTTVQAVDMLSCSPPSAASFGGSGLISRSSSQAQSRNRSAINSDPFSDGLFGGPLFPLGGVCGGPPSPAPPSGRLFGACPPPASPSGGSFGAPLSSSGGSFGAPLSSSGGLFGAPLSSSGGLLGGPPPAPPSGGSFGAPLSSSGGLFSGPPPGPPSGRLFSSSHSTSTSGSSFGGPPSLSSGLFGGPPSGPSSHGLFGGPPSSSTGSFGGLTVNRGGFNHSQSGSTMSMRGNQEVLTKIISLQKAEGFWQLDEIASQIFSQNLTELSRHCPVECDKRVWATTLVLARLEEKFSAQRDEWELVASKAELWLEQIVDKSIISKLTEAARSI